MINSRAKGCRGERMWRDVLKKHGHEARRGQQFSGSPDSPDVVCPSLPIHFEVKCVQNLNIQKAFEQSQRDCGESKIPVVAHKKNGKDWLVTLDGETFVAMMTIYFRNHK